MNITLRQLSAFVVLAKTGAFTSAATRLHITQSALSALIKDLEQALDVQLVHRTTRSVQLSDVGAQFLPLAQRILDDLERAKRSIAELKSLNAGQVRIAVPQLMACTLMPQVVAAFTAQHPKVDVLIVDCDVEDIPMRVLSGEADLGIGPERAVSSELAVRPLFDLPFLAVFPQDHPLGRQKQVAWADLARYPLISLRDDYTRMLNSQLTAMIQLELEPAYEVAFVTTALSMVATGLGITTCLPYAVSLLDLHRLQRRQLVEPSLTRKFHVYSRAERQLGPVAQGFAEFLVGYFDARDWNATFNESEVPLPPA
ncbi:LysR family transcriptional regulator [Burkholderia sp. SRS-W-2-2016]|uniref:LysR family transcriptional regulator n=1 Tax=Burkholderia sp. SRS-W-2-2016 TaxID=1926878 RepID=UPI00094AD4CD|nr:LysR family transcriptional regulator [Burkholderia sp. SRS-W-2-2016]OLL30610.1 LysR family transcriptional regulator [Burkholderia sp. SRS-W-2-2016]